MEEDSVRSVCSLMDGLYDEPELALDPVDDALPFPRLSAGKEAVRSMKCEVELAKDRVEAEAEDIARSD